ncbi:MAG: glycosyltransferase family 9 protein [Candidatus Brocadiia bacterium]
MPKLRPELAEALAVGARPRVSVLRAGGLGDTLLTLPALQILLAEAPDAQVTLVGSAWADRLRPLMAREFHVRRFDAGQLSAWFRPDLARDDSGLLSGADAVVIYSAGRADALERNARRLCAGTVIVHPLRPPAGTHATAHFARAVAQVEAAGDVPVRALSPPDHLAEWAEGWLGARLPGRTAPLAVHAGSGGARKCWPAERFAALVRRMERPCLVLEGPADEAATGRLLERLPAAVPARGLGLGQIGALLRGCVLLVCNDSGVAHLAAALAVPTVAVFGPTDPRTWAPRGPAVAVVASDGTDAWPATEQVLEAARSLQTGRV